MMHMSLTDRDCRTYLCIPNFYFDEIAFTYWKPKPVNNLYTIPYTFQLSVWMGVVLSIFLIFLAALIIGYDKQHIIFSSFKVSLLPIMNEAWAINKTSYRETWSKSMLLTIWLLSGALLTMAFQSNLLASFAIIKYGPDMNTLEEIYASGKKVYLSEGTLAEKLVKNSNDTYLKAIYNDLILKKDGVVQYTKMKIENSTLLQDLKNHKALLVFGKTHVFAKYGPMMRMSEAKNASKICRMAF